VEGTINGKERDELERNNYFDEIIQAIKK